MDREPDREREGETSLWCWLNLGEKEGMLPGSLTRDV